MDKEDSPKIEKANFPLALNRQQAEVVELLRSLADERHKYHEWYQGAIQIINSQSPDKLAQAAHSIRELCDQLPSRIGNIPAFKSPLPPVKALRSDFLEVKTKSYTGGWKGETISPSLDRLLFRLEEIFQLFNEPPRTARLRLALTSSDPRGDLISNQQREERDETFEQIGRFFQGVAHHSLKPDESEFSEKLELFESLLLNYLTPCTAAQQDEIITLMKGSPSAAALKRINELISYKGANSVFFFEKLDNPDWLELLDQKGYFSNLPGSEATSDNFRREQFHIPLVALTRLASSAPQTVTNILLKLKLPDNRKVGDQILECMERIQDAGFIAQLRPLTAQFGEKPSQCASWFRIQNLLLAWIKVGAFSDALAMTQSFLYAAVGSTSSTVDAWLVTQVDEKVLTPLTVDLPFDVFKIIFKALCDWARWEQEEYQPSDRKPDGPFSYWFQDFKVPAQSHRQLEITLVLRLFTSADQIYRQGDVSKVQELDRLLRSHPWRLFQRLRWQLYTDYPSLGFDQARNDVLARMPFLNQLAFIHDYEFAQLLQTCATFQGAAFLSPAEIEQFFTAVLQGPVDELGKPFEGYEKGVFHLKQLWPISSLLAGEQLRIYQTLVPDSSGIDFQSYKPFRSDISGSFQITQIAPPEADNLAAMDEDGLWNFLNNWEPATNYPTPDRRGREDIGALGTKFSELVAQQPARFRSTTRWWEKLTRAAIVHQVFNNAIDYFIKKQNGANSEIPPPTENDWGNWFGIAKFIIAMRVRAETEDPKESPQKSDWQWSLKSVANFYRMALKSGYDIPSVYLSELKESFETLLRNEASQAYGEHKPTMNDWLTTAINSVEGEVIEALLNLAFRQKKATETIEPWIFSLIRSRLERPGASPSVFAMLGGNLPFVIYLFGSELKLEPTLLFPPAKPAHQQAAIVANFCYLQPNPVIVQTFPDLFDAAIKILETNYREANGEDSDREGREFGARLGTHIAVYQLNGAFSNNAVGEALLDRYFAVAPESARASCLSQLASILSGLSSDERGAILIPRGMRILGRRYERIVNELKSKPADFMKYDTELAAFAHWLNCECIPFDWRIINAKLAFQHLKKPKHLYSLLKTISTFAGQADRLDACLQILGLILAKPSDELQWSVQFDELGPVISAGLASDVANIRKQAESCRDLLLKLGFFQFGSLGNERAK